MLSIGETAKYLSVSRSSLGRWDRAGLLHAYRTPGGHRRYSLDRIQHFYKNTPQKIKKPAQKRHILCYARVSGHKQKEKGDLRRQLNKLQQSAKQKGDSQPILIKDVGSGLNSSRTGLKKVFHYVRSGMVAKIIISYKDRLTWFGFRYIEEFCTLFGVPIIEIEQVQHKSVQQSLVDDMMTLIACFSGKLYGMRSKKSRARKSRARSQQKYFKQLIRAEIENVVLARLPQCFKKSALRKLLI